MQAIWEFLSDNVAVLGLIVAFLGSVSAGTFTLYQLYQKRREGRARAQKEREERVREMHRCLDNGMLGVSRHTVEAAWATPDARKALAENDNDPQAFLAYAKDMAVRENLGEHLIRLREHFADMARCVAIGDCDARLAAVLYFDDVKRFLAAYQHWLEDEGRYRREDLTVDLLQFLERTKPEKDSVQE